jgi:phage tail sheath gpL-like
MSYDLVNDGFGSTATFTSVAAQLKSHVQEARGTAQSERGGYLGMEGTFAEILAQAAILNDTDVQLFPQKLTVLNVNGELTEMPEWVSAVTAAGMRSGAPEVGTPLTFKLVKTTDLSQDSSWSPQNLTNKNQLIQGGVMFVEPAPTGGFRWVRDLTTHLLDDNIAFIDGNVRDSVRFIAYDLRNFIENRFTGLKAIPATVASIKESTAAQLRTYLNANIIVESRDPENPNSTAIIPGFRRLRVSVQGNTAEIKVQIFPAIGIVFELISLTLGLATIVAP